MYIDTEEMCTKLLLWDEISTTIDSTEIYYVLFNPKRQE